MSDTTPGPAKASIRAAEAAVIGVNLAHGFGHRFIYSREVLRQALLKAGFASITEHLIQQSGDLELCNLENDGRMPPGFLQLETMTLEGEAAVR